MHTDRVCLTCLPMGAFHRCFFSAPERSDTSPLLPMHTLCDPQPALSLASYPRTKDVQGFRGSIAGKSLVAGTGERTGLEGRQHNAHVLEVKTLSQKNKKGQHGRRDAHFSTNQFPVQEKRSAYKISSSMEFVPEGADELTTYDRGVTYTFFFFITFFILISQIPYTKKRTAHEISSSMEFLPESADELQPATTVRNQPRVRQPMQATHQN